MGVIAIFGGSFDPPHVGHVLAASYVLATAAVDGVVVAPTFEHPFAKPLRAFEHRLEMCRRAFADLARVEVSDIEARLGGPSWTYRLVEALAAERPRDSLRFVIGSDILAERHRWRHWERIEQLAPPLVVTRAGHAVPGLPPGVLPEIASREVRAALAEGRDVAHWIPRAVLAYVREHGLYSEAG